MRNLSSSRLVAVAVTTLVLSAVALVVTGESASADPCSPLVNPVACENSKPGTAKSTWDISGAGDAGLQGFATQMSVNVGEAESFKVATAASSYRVDIYRMGYYGGNGARLITSFGHSGVQSQPDCLTNVPTLLVDCGNWAVSASWTVPTTAVSGVYFAKLTRTDGTTGSSHIVFVVRDDASHSDLVFQTSDETWQAYNEWGGNSLYTTDQATPTQDRAYKVSYNRPFSTRGTGNQDFVFEAEYPMVRFLEANGYDISYMAGADVDRRGALLTNHKAFVAAGHDEYWSGPQRANVEAARDAGVNLAFFTGNEVFWKTRWENSIDGSGTAYRTLVTYKETHQNAVSDPKDPPTWTGTWMDPRFSPPADGGRPQNSLTGTIFTVNSGTQSLQVPAADGKLRFWRDTSVATLGSGSTATLGTGTVGYEWDSDVDNGFRPAGLIDMSHTTAGNLAVLIDFGSNYETGSATHSITLYRAPSGALVFGAGTTQWSWGLDTNHDLGVEPSAGSVSAPMKQATVNLFADMGAQPTTLQSGLTSETRSTDTTAPTATISAPAGGASVAAGSSVTVSGTASDVGGVVGGVEVSVDGGTTWHPANGRGSWSYTATMGAPGSTTIQARATDDSGNIGTPASIPVTVNAPGCPCSIWTNSVTPPVPSEPDGSAVELGVRFRADVAGKVTGVRFYKGSGNTGTHVGHLWSNTGSLLASVTFSGESSGGWQSANFSSPVTVTAGTTYVVSYYAPVGHYSDALIGGFGQYPVVRYPLRALNNWTDGPNGLFHYGSGGGFPSDSYEYSNYFVDALFTPTGPDTIPPTVTSHTPASNATGVSTGTAVTATFSEPVQAGTVAMSLVDNNNVAVAGTTAYNSSTNKATFTPSAALAVGVTYTATVSGAKDVAGNTMAPVTWSFTTATPPTCPCTIWPGSTTPATAATTDASLVELGTKFRSDVAGTVTGVRFYKGSGNGGTHVGHLWTSTGTLLATVTFTGETASGWQQATFASPVSITAGTTYVVSYYAPQGHYADNFSYFTSSVDRSPLHGLADGTDGGNGVYRYASGGGFPNSTYQSSNYWVDVVFTPGP